MMQCKKWSIPLVTFKSHCIHFLVLGCTLLYTDTDSIIYEAPEDYNPLETGDYLGEFTDECKGYDIEEFYCAGPKQYLLIMKDQKDGSIKTSMKIRGMTLDENASSKISITSFKEAVLQFLPLKIIF